MVPILRRNPWSSSFDVQTEDLITRDTPVSDVDGSHPCYGRVSYQVLSKMLLVGSKLNGETRSFSGRDPDTEKQPFCFFDLTLRRLQGGLRF